MHLCAVHLFMHTGTNPPTNLQFFYNSEEKKHQSLDAIYMRRHLLWSLPKTWAGSLYHSQTKVCRLRIMATRLHAKNGNGCSNEVQMRETMRALPVREQTVRRAKREAQAFPETCSQERRKWSWPWQSGTFEWRDQPTISSFLFIKCPGGVLRLPLQCLFPLLCPFIKNQVLKKKVLEKSQLVVED